MKKILIVLAVVFSIVFSNAFAFAQGTGASKVSDKKFTDISGHWAEKAINEVADKEIFAGKDGKFIPGKPITRSEFVIMLHKALGIQIKYFKAPDIKEFFDDVKNEDACASALYDLVVANIIDVKGHFRPNDTLPREEMIHYIINGLKSVTGGEYALITMMPAPFADDSKINPAYKNDIVEAVLLKLVYGRGNNMLHPKSQTTRAEAAAVIHRLTVLLETLNARVDVTPAAEISQDGLKMKLTIANNTKKAVTINHSSGQKFDFKLLDADKNILYTWSADKLFIMALTETVIEPGKSVEFSDTLNFADHKDIKDKAKFLKAYITGKSDSFAINPDGYDIEIK